MCICVFSACRIYCCSLWLVRCPAWTANPSATVECNHNNECGMLEKALAYLPKIYLRWNTLCICTKRSGYMLRRFGWPIGIEWAVDWCSFMGQSMRKWIPRRLYSHFYIRGLDSESVRCGRFVEGNSREKLLFPQTLPTTKMWNCNQMKRIQFYWNRKRFTKR